MEPPSTELLLRVNGVRAAFGIEFGFDSERANKVAAARKVTRRWMRRGHDVKIREQTTSGVVQLQPKWEIPDE